MKQSHKAGRQRKVLEKSFSPNETSDRGITRKINWKRESKESEIARQDLAVLGSDELANDAGDDEPLK